MRVGLAFLLIAAVWGLAVVLAEPLDEREREGPPVAAAGLPSALTFDSGTRPLPRNRFTVRPAPLPTAVRVKFKRPPAAGLLFDVRSGQVLWQLNPRRELPIASLTKMMTGLMVAESNELGERVQITPRVLAYAGSGVGVLPAGKRVKVKALLAGLMLVSGNDAALALAQHNARTVGAFVRKMNARAHQLGLGCSRFSSPSGIKDEGNYSCPLDLATLARMDLANRLLRPIIGAERIRMKFPVKGGVLDLFNINPFIEDPGVTGVKTGLTNAAGRCYVITAKIGGRHLGVVLLDSPDPLHQVPRLLQAGARA